MNIESKMLKIKTPIEYKDKNMNAIIPSLAHILVT
jgi:hypothetical protein